MMKTTYKKCYCTETLHPDGTCRHGCPPELRKPGARAKKIISITRERERRATSTTTMLGTKETREGIAKALPLRVRYAGCEEFIARVGGR